MSEQTPASGPVTDGPADPEHDATAAYGLDRAYVASLTRRLVSTTGETVAVASPIGGTPLAHVPQSSPADVAEAFARARRAQASWAATSIDDRAAALLRLHDLLLDRQEELIDLVVWESGKARKDAYLEVAHLALTARYYARTAHEHLDTRARRRHVPGAHPGRGQPRAEGRRRHHLALELPAHHGALRRHPALLAGNAVVSKPDAQTVLTALLGRPAARGGRLPARTWQVVAGAGPEVGGAIVENADYVCFTGSTATGRIVAKECAERLIGCSLELGGKNPMLVLRDADVHRAAEGAIRAVFSNAGQLCVSMERLFVADQVYDRFVDAFVARTQAMTLGASQEWYVDMGSLISQAQLDTVTRHVEDAVAKGATRARRRQGAARPRAARLRAHHPRGRLGRHGVLRQGDLRPGRLALPLPRRGRGDRARQRRRYGLNASVWTRDAARGRALARRIACGTVNVNEAYGATFGSLGAPMGGMRESGLGRRQGAEGIHRYTEAQSVAIQRLVPIAPMFGMSEETNAKVMTGACGCSTSWAGRERPVTTHYDVLVIGSGFGGSVSALRLTEKGYTVGVLEAGARFDDDELPEHVVRREEVPLRARRSGCYGIQRIDMRARLLHPRRRRRRRRLAGLRQHALRALDAFYQRPAVGAHHRLEVRARALLRPGQADARRRRRTRVPRPPTRSMKKVADEMGVGDTFHPTPVGVFFGEPGQAGARRSPTRSSAAPGRTGNACINCGECMTGCRHNAKNTLVKNYLYLAEQAGAVVHPLTTVTDVRPRAEGGYEVTARWTKAKLSRRTRREDVHRRPGGLLRRRARHAAAAAPAQGRGLAARDLRPARASSRAPTPRRSSGPSRRTTPSTTRRASRSPRRFHPDEHTHVEPVRYGTGSNVMALLPTVLADEVLGEPRWRTWLQGAVARSAATRATSTTSSTGRERTVIALVMQTLDNSITTVWRKRGGFGCG